MKNIEIVSRFSVAALDELSEHDRELVRVAMESTKSSYAPYSGFHVGAALRLVDDTIVRGCNQENASYGATQCAERNALHHAGCYYPDVAPVALACAAFTCGEFLDMPIPPCGICRQAVLETEKRYGVKMRILLYGRCGVWVCDGVENLLPLQFNGDFLS